MALTRKQTALLHVAKKHLSLEDADYRAILRQEAGVESSRALDADGFKVVLRRFGELGFVPSSRRADLGWRVGMASPEQVGFIRSLWKQYTKGEGDDRSLGKWLQRTVQVSDIRFVTYANASKAITALLAMVTREREAA